MRLEKKPLQYLASKDLMWLGKKPLQYLASKDLMRLGKKPLQYLGVYILYIDFFKK